MSDLGESIAATQSRVNHRRALTSASASGKVILFGEHAVVYGRPAIAVPVTDVQATAVVDRGPKGQGVVICATDLGLHHRLDQAATAGQAAYPLEVTVRNALRSLGQDTAADLTVTVSSTVPMASGMGSGAAVATAMVRALALFFGRRMGAQEVSDLVYQTEVIHHGTPSGIDNAVIAFEQPVYFVRGRPIEVLRVRRPFALAIGDTGIQSPTRVAVGDVRREWEADPQKYDAWFDRIGAIAALARRAIETGAEAALGDLMNQNQELLRAIGVSCPELETLISAARAAGAAGAKLCGAGRGGNMIALVTPESASEVAASLRASGAVRVIVTRVEQTGRGLHPPQPG